MFQVQVDPDREITALIGSKEGIGQVCLAFLNPGDLALVPDPAYPAYYSGVVLAGGIPHSMLLLAEKGLLPDLEAIDKDTARRARIMFLNYPNNPTAGTAAASFFENVIDFIRENVVIICHDFIYGTMVFDSDKPPSFLSIKGAKEVGIEFMGIQAAAVEALNLPLSHYDTMNTLYHKRRDFLVDGLNR